MRVFPTRLQTDPRVRVEKDGSTTDLIRLDADAKTFLASAPIVTPEGDVSLQPYCIDMDQLSESSCAGNATCEGVEILNNLAGYKPTPLSRQFVYNLSRQENGNLDKDNGTFIRSCFDVISRFGVCDEYLFPYDVTKYNAMPSFMAMRQAMGHKIHKAYRIKDTLNPKDRIESCIQALRANHPVVFGTQVSSSYQALSDNTIQYPPTNNIVGGHAQVIVGWIQGYFLVKNSWGTGWGMRGFSYFSPSYITWHQTSDLWVPTIGSEF